MTGSIRTTINTDHPRAATMADTTEEEAGRGGLPGVEFWVSSGTGYSAFGGTYGSCRICDGQEGCN